MCIRDRIRGTRGPAGPRVPRIRSGPGAMSMMFRDPTDPGRRGAGAIAGDPLAVRRGVPGRPGPVADPEK
eukprot:157750-Hanusia_phi.AAC.2